MIVSPIGKISAKKFDEYCRASNACTRTCVCNCNFKKILSNYAIRCWRGVRFWRGLGFLYQTLAATIEGPPNQPMRCGVQILLLFLTPTLLCSAGERLVHLRIVTAAESLGNDAATESSRVANERYTPNAFYHFLQAHRQPFAAVALGNMGNLDRNELRNLYAAYIFLVAAYARHVPNRMRKP